MTEALVKSLPTHSWQETIIIRKEKLEIFGTAHQEPFTAAPSQKKTKHQQSVCLPLLSSPLSFSITCRALCVVVVHLPRQLWGNITASLAGVWQELYVVILRAAWIKTILIALAHWYLNHHHRDGVWIFLSFLQCVRMLYIMSASWSVADSMEDGGIDYKESDCARTHTKLNVYMLRCLLIYQLPNQCSLWMSLYP